MSIGMATDSWAFASASWAWDVEFDEIGVDELVQATECSLLEIVADGLADFCDGLLGGGIDESLTGVQQTATETLPGELPPDSTAAGLPAASPVADWPFSPVAADLASQVPRLPALPLRTTPPAAQVSPKPPAAPTVRLQGRWHLAPSCWWQVVVNPNLEHPPKASPDDADTLARSSALRTPVARPHASLPEAAASAGGGAHGHD